jgi:sugar phosphate isomerase/epimerase
MLEICMSSCYYDDMSPEEAVTRLVKNDWRYLELSSEHGRNILERGKPDTNGYKFRCFVDDAGAFIPQGHLWLKCDIAAENQDEVIDRLKRWIDVFLGIGIRNAVLHPGGQQLRKQECEPEKIHKKRVKALRVLTDYIHDTEMILCLENTLSTIPDIDGLIELIKSVESPNLGICLDTGHLNRSGGSQREFIHKAKPYLKALHINDNEGVHDQHMMPYGRGTIDWDEVIDALKEIEFSEVFNLEIPGESNCPAQIRDAKLDYLKTIIPIMLK